MLHSVTFFENNQSVFARPPFLSFSFSFPRLGAAITTPFASRLVIQEIIMAEEAEPDTASWVEVEVTLYFTAVTTAAFLLIFEIGRRSPTMKSAVFDRRRQHAPVKTPPPLMNGLGEWLFVSTDPEYWEYADMVHWKKVIQERKRQQQDLEQRNARRHRAQQQGGGGGRLLRGPLELVGSRSSGGGRDSHDDEYDVENGNAPPNSSSNNSNKKQYLRLLSNGSSNNNSTSNRAIEPTHYLTPDVFELDGRRLPIAIAEYAISNDLTEEQLDQYQYQLYQREQLEEQKYKQAVEQEHIGQNVPSKLQYIGVRQRNSIYLTFWKRFCGCCFRRKNNTNDNDDPNNNNTLNNDPRSVRSFLTTSSDDRISRVSSGRSILASNRRRGSATSNALHDTSTAPVNRHLKTQTAANKRPLGIADEELLRCVGLDTYVMIRFLRWAYDCTFYPFLLACITIIPVYYTNPYEGDSEEGIITGGYFRFTINRLEAESVRLWVPWAYAIVFYCYCLRRVWVEWETFIALRFDFLANGDVGQNQQQQQDILRQQKRKQKQQQIQHGQHRPQNDVELHLEQYRNSCLVEYIPDSHNRDRELFEFFSAIFPNQVKRAEILLNATRLTRLIQERQNYIESYENLYAIHFREKQMYRGRNNGDNDDDEGQGGSNGSGRRRSKHGKPQEPKIALTNIKRPRCWPCQGQKLVKAFPYYLSEIKRLNIEIEEEHERIMVEKQKSEDTQESQNLFSMGLELGSRFVTGESTELTCTTGFVEFTNLTAKQNAIQCNLTGETNFMRTTSAPDPRDLIWENATVEASLIQWKRLQCDSLLLTGALFWSVVVTFITSISNLDRLDDFLPSWLIPKEDTFWYGLIQGYLPVIFLEFFMMFVPPILRAIAQNFIRFKTRSEVDKFVFLWHFVYRLANLLIIIVSGSIYDTLTEGISSPSAVISKIAGNIAQSSQFFLNNMIVAAGTENFFELSQSLQIIIHLGVQQVIQMEAKSNRQMEKLKAAAQFEWGWVMPPFIFAFLVGAVYCTMVPVVLGACAIFFYIATKVYIHQALYVYAQPYEGGGKLMYMLNRTVFTILYIAIIIFSTVLGLRQAPLQGPSFFFIMMIITLYMDRRVQTKFVKPSLTLALTNSRFIDEDNKKKAERAQRYQEYKAAKEEKRLDELRKSGKGGKAATVASSLKQRGKRESKSKDGDDFYLYRQPMLNKLLWETKPRPYR